MKPRRRPGRSSARSTPPGQHSPVMLREVLEVLDPRPGEVAADCTVGLAGHALAILERVGPAGQLIGLDWDSDNLGRASERLKTTGLPCSIVASNFAALPQVLAGHQLDGVDVLVADLGMSSPQLDDPDRGFSYVRDGPLDMRMDRSRGRTASEILATISETELANALRSLGDEPLADPIARSLIAAREQQPITTTAQLAQIVGQAVNRPVSRAGGWHLKTKSNAWESHPAARTFQVLRMLVNRELGNLQELLRVLPGCLRPGGRAAIISFHSGEDRLVKAALRDGLERGVFEQVSAEPVRATHAERLANPRSRSAKLRWARRPLWTAVA